MADPSNPLPDGLDALLREEAWLRRLAVGLTGDVAAAEDLTQDVVATALRERPRVEGPGLKAWLRTVARRLAIRGGERERNRRNAERAAARPESADRRAEERLALHQRLTDAIQALEPPYRTVLVLRYLEGLPPQEIARRLGLSEAAARKRVSRGLAQLRESLDEEFGDRGAWLGAVGCLASGDGWVPHPPVAAAAATTTIAVSLARLSIMNKVAIGGVVAASLLFVAVRSIDALRAPRVERDTAVVDIAHAPGAGDQNADQSTDIVTVPAAVSERSVGGEPATEAAPATRRLLIVDPSGQPAIGATAAWIDPRREVQEIELDEGASAELPERAPGKRFYAGASGFATAFVDAKGSGDDVTITLAKAVELRGRVEVDGAAPGVAVPVRRLSNGSHLGLASDDETRRAQESRLTALGLLDAACRVETGTDGTFSFMGVHPEQAGSVLLPASYGSSAANRHGSVVDYDSSRRDLLISVSRGPFLFGRFVWADDRTPVEGGFLVVYEREGNGTAQTVGMGLWDDGYFEVSLPLDDEGGRSYVSVALEAGPRRGSRGGSRHRFELAGHDLPWDVGTLLVQRAAELDVLVVDDQDRPVSGALVYTNTSGLRAETTGADGVVHIAAKGAEELNVLALGFTGARIAIPAAPTEPDGSIVVRLDPGIAVRITLDGLVLDDALRALPQLILDHELSLFDHGLDDELEALKWCREHLLAEHRAILPYIQRGEEDGVLSYSTRFKCTGKPIELAALRPGAEFDARLVDVFGNTLVHAHITVPETHGVHDVMLDCSADVAGALTVRLTDEENVPIDEAWVMVRTGRSGTGQSVSGGSVTLSPVATGRFDLRASATGYMGADGSGELTGGQQSVALQLRRAQNLQVDFVDEHGGAARPDWAVLRASDGWTSGKSPRHASRWQLEGVPVTELEALVRMGTRVLRRAVEVVDGEAVVVLPASGSLRVHVATVPELQSDWGQVTVRVVEVGGRTSLSEASVRSDLPDWMREEHETGAFTSSELFSRDATGSLNVTMTVLPGEYAVAVDVVDPFDDEGVRRTLLETEITVNAGDRAQLDVAGEH